MTGLFIHQMYSGMPPSRTTRRSEAPQLCQLARLCNVHAARGLKTIVGHNVRLLLQHPPQLLLLNALLAHATAQCKLLVQGKPAVREGKSREGSRPDWRQAAAAAGSSGSSKPFPIAGFSAAIELWSIAFSPGQVSAPYPG